MGNNIDLSWDKIKHWKLSIGTIASMIVAYGWLMYWMDANFISEVQGAHITTKVEDNKKLIEEHIEEYRITNVMDSIRQLKYVNYELEQQEARDGFSQLLSDRRQEVENDLEQAQEYKICLLKPPEIRPKCEYLAK